MKTGNNLGLVEREENGILIQTPCLCFRRNFLEENDECS